MAEEKKPAAKKPATAAKKPAASTAKKAAPKAEAPKAEAPKAAPKAKVSHKTGKGNKKAAITNRLQAKYEAEVKKA